MVLPRYKAAVIGAGWIGTGYSANNPTKKLDNHQDAYLGNPRIEYVGSFEQNWNELPDCDIVSICTPVDTHHRIVCALAPRVKAILCEKPMATTLQDANEMIQTCRKYGTVLQVNYQRHFTTPVFRFSRDGFGHAIDLLQDIFGPVIRLEQDRAVFNYTSVDLEYCDTSDKPWDESHIFELDFCHNEDLMIPKSIENIIRLLDEGQTESNALQARESLRLELQWKELYESAKAPVY